MLFLFLEMLFLFLDATLIFRNAILIFLNTKKNLRKSGPEEALLPTLKPYLLTQYNGRESQVLTNSKCIFFGTFFGGGAWNSNFFICGTNKLVAN